MPVTLLRKSTGVPYTNPNWTRLEKHIARHEKAGGLATVNRRHLDEPITLGADAFGKGGIDCIELADVELFEPSPFI